jgi:glycosyltransferase involved in cell wall biosynthesis
MNQPDIHLVTFGDPKDTRSFSGTNNAIYREICRRNRLAEATDVEYLSPDRPLRNQLLIRFSKWYYQNAHFDFKGRWHHWARARQAARTFRQSRARNVLHILTFALPLGAREPGQRHYLFIDSTWNSWARYVTNLDAYPARLAADIDYCDRQALRQVDHIFVTGEYLKDNIVGHYGISPKKISVVGTGMGAIKPYHGPKDYANKTILFVAKVRFKDKGRPLLLEAFSAAQRRDPSLKLIIAGDDEFHRNPPSLPNLRTYGFTNLAQLQSLFEEASLFVLPAVNEGWGLVYLEAMSCRVPIVGLHRNSIPEFIQGGRHGFSIQDGSAEELADVLVQAFADPICLEKMGTEGQQFVADKYTWEKTVDRITSIIDHGAKEQ